ncbi:MAG: O-antigen ligase family protein [Gemmataceae bacterium]|nr:O-antigen ligase family protein [Gemmataceae bacterium]
MLWLLIGYMFLFIHRTFEIWPVLATVRLEFCYMLVAGIAWLCAAGKHWPSNCLTWAVPGFVFAVFLCALASPHADHCFEFLDSYFKMMVFWLMLTTMVRTELDFRRLMGGFVFVFFLYLLHSFREYFGGRYVVRMGISRMIGVDPASDPNSFASHILFVLVFVPAVWVAWPTRRVRVFLASFVVLGLAAILLTGSRGAFLSMLIVALVFVAQSNARKWLAPAAILAAPLVWFILPDTLQNRFMTILDPSVGPANAAQSGEARIIGFNTGLQLFEANPITGVGPKAWRPATGNKLESHNLYGQLMGEMGGIGVLAFLSLVSCYVVNLWRIRQAYRAHPEWGRDFLFHVTRAIGMALFLLLFEGNFGHNLFRYTWIWYAAFLVMVRQCVEHRLAMLQAEPLAEWDGETYVDEPRAWDAASC